MPLLPTRVRRHLERVSLWSMRFRPSVDTHYVRSGPPHASLLAAGDVVLSRDIEAAIRHRGATTIFAPLKPVLDGCDLRVANLESPLIRREAKPGALGGVLKAAPESVEALAVARFDLVILQLHWGVEFAMYPWLSHRDRARRFVEA